MSEQQALDVGGPPWRVLTLHQPWGSAMIDGTPEAGVKDVENRGTRTRWRGRVFIQAGRFLDIPARRVTPELEEALRAAGLRWAPVEVPDWAWPAGALENPLILPFGAVLGYVEFYACTSHWNPSRWAFAATYHYWARRPVKIDPPIPAVGQQNFWTPKPEDPRNPGLYTKLSAIS